MVFWRWLWLARGEKRLQEKLVEMTTEFCLEASVLVTVLGILDSAISTQRVPSFRVFVLSGLVGGLFLCNGPYNSGLKFLGDSPSPANDEEDQ